MEPRKDLNVSEGAGKVHARNDVEPSNKEGGLQMETTYNLNDAFAKSPLRKARYECMREHLQRNGEYYFSKGTQDVLKSWTREQIEQALDDVIVLGYGKVTSTEHDGALLVEFIGKAEKAKKPLRP